MIHYHGTPITPKAELQKMAGKNLCVSFSDKRDGEWALKHAQSVMWDNGAFSAFTKGKAFDFNGYYEWLEDKIGHPHWAVVPDVIGGNFEEQKILLQTWPYPKDFGCPVWHLDKPIDYLLELADNWPKVCFGSSGDYWQVGSSSWCHRVDKAFNALSSRHSKLPWVHMLRGLSLCGEYFPFASADSTNVARNFKCQKKDPEKMARKLDAIQCPINWTLRPTQTLLI